MRREDRIRLRHMRDAAREALSFGEGRCRGDLDTDRQFLMAVLMEIGIVGEAASRVTPDARAGLPEIPWPAIVARRNRLIHAYFDVDADLVWTTLQEDLPMLVAAPDRALGGIDE